MSKGKKQILIVDDEPEIVDILVGYLENDYTTITADGVAKAQTILKKDKIDLLITDLGLSGGTSGEELLDFIDSNKLGVRVIVLSGISERKNDVLKKGAIGWLNKPFKGQALLDLVSSVFSNKVTPKSK